MADAKPVQMGVPQGDSPKRDTGREVRWRPGMPETAKPARRIPNAQVNENKPEEQPGASEPIVEPIPDPTVTDATTGTVDAVATAKTHEAGAEIQPPVRRYDA